MQDRKPHSEKRASHDQSARAFRLGVRRKLAGRDEIYAGLSHLGRLLPPTHDQDLARKTHGAIGGIRTKSFEDVTFHFFFLMLRQPPKFTLFPYTTLFR